MPAAATTSVLIPGYVRSEDGHVRYTVLIQSEGAAASEKKVVQCSRRFSEFLRLHDALTREREMPPFPAPRRFFHNDCVRQTRARQLQQWLAEVLESAAGATLPPAWSRFLHQQALPPRNYAAAEVVRTVDGSGGVDSLRHRNRLACLATPDDSDEDASPHGSRLRRPPPLERSSFDVTHTMTFESGDIRLKPEGMLESPRGQRDQMRTGFDLRTQLSYVKTLGKGASGTVHLARHARSGELYAVKELRAMAEEHTRHAAINELRIASRHAAHRNLVRPRTDRTRAMQAPPATHAYPLHRTRALYTARAALCT
jgi:hypothetical protein